MNPEDKKSKFLSKLDAPAKPVITQVVPVAEEAPKKPDVPAKLDHFNLYTDKAKGKALRLLKVETETSIQDMLEEALTDYLRKKGKL